MAKIISFQKAKERIYSVHGDQIEIIEETYISFFKNCKFLDKNFGIFETLPFFIYKGRVHPERSRLNFKKKFKEKSFISLEEVKEKLFFYWGEIVLLIEESYIDFNKMAKFVDIKYGEYEGVPKRVCWGVCHPLRRKENYQNKIKITLEEAKKRVFEAHGNQVKIIEETYFYFTKKCQFEDINYGIWQASPKSVSLGHGHPKRRIKNIKIIFENKTIKEKYEILEKRIQTNLLIRNVKFPSQSSEIKEKTIQNSLKKHGVAYPQQLLSVKEKQRNTIKNKSSEEKNRILETRILTCLKKYKKKSVSQVDEFIKQKHQTMLKNGTYGKSKQEDQFYEFLLTIFEQNDIERQFLINKNWPIDFYIKSKNLYVQFDGEYWHGLDTSFSKLILRTTPRAIGIINKYNHDLKQNQWFQENNLKLFRVICGKYKELPFEEIKQILIS